MGSITSVDIGVVSGKEPVLNPAITKGEVMVESGGIQVPQKFVNSDGSINTEALVKSYTHLEKNRGKTPEPAVSNSVIAAPVAAPVGDKGTNHDTKVDNSIPPKPNYANSPFSAEEATKWSEEINAGGLGDESYKELEKRGFGKEIVDTFIAGQKAVANSKNNEVFELVGGKDNYNKAMQWASTNLDKKEIAQYNAAIKSEGRDFAVKGLFSRYNGSNVNLIQGTNTYSQAGYSSMTEMMADIQDPRYSTDAYFRSNVETRARNSHSLK